MQTNYVSRDTYGMYKNYSSSSGPGPALMGADTLIGKVLAPFERIVGFVLLTSETVNSIKGNQGNTGGGGR